MGCDDEEKIKMNPDFKKKLIKVCWQRHINQQAIAQTGLKLNVVDTTNIKVLCCTQEVVLVGGIGSGSALVPSS